MQAKDCGLRRSRESPQFHACIQTSDLATLYAAKKHLSFMTSCFGVVPKSSIGCSSHCSFRVALDTAWCPVDHEAVSICA